MKRLLQRIKAWWGGAPVQARPSHAYAISGWVRGADGVYRNGDATICRRGREWVRSDGKSFPTLHTAIKPERIEPDPAALFEEMSRAAAAPLISAQRSEDGQDA